MEVKSLQQYSKITGRYPESIRASLNVYTERLPAYVYYDGKFHPVDKEIVCVIYGEGSPKTRREIYNEAKPPKIKIPNKEKAALYRKNRLSENSHFKFSCGVRSLLYNSFKRACNGKYRKSKNTESMLGCSMQQFLEHISQQFKDGMSFENYGEWHLDHIKPIKLAQTREEIIELNHYSNLQPLWAIDNIKKSYKYEQ